MAAAAAVIPRQPTNKRNQQQQQAATNKNAKWPLLMEMEAPDQAHPHPRAARRKTPAAPTRHRWHTTTTIQVVQAAIHRKMVLARIIKEDHPVASVGVAVAVAHGKGHWMLSNAYIICYVKRNISVYT